MGVTSGYARSVKTLRGHRGGTQAKDLADGMLYLNVHIAAHPPGEIRGQLMKK